LAFGSRILNPSHTLNEVDTLLGNVFENGENAQKMHFWGLPKANFLGEDSQTLCWKSVRRHSTIPLLFISGGLSRV
jgi:hypothetical protein